MNAGVWNHVKQFLVHVLEATSIINEFHEKFSLENF